MAGLARRLRDFAYWRMRRGTSLARHWRHQTRELVNYGLGSWTNRHHARVGPKGVDPRITYPCYKSLDAYVDVERLRSLDGFLLELVRRHLDAGESEPFNTGYFKKNLLSRALPGSRVIPLSVSKRPFNYLDLGRPGLWEPSELAADFGPLMEFIDTLPFASTARMIIMCDDRGRRVSAHRDHSATDTLNEFVWFRTNLDKPFFVQDVRSERKRHVHSYTAWFDTVNQYHGADETGRPSISVRVDGRFTDEFRARIPQPATNLASTPALWACMSG